MTRLIIAFVLGMLAIQLLQWLLVWLAMRDARRMARNDIARHQSANVIQLEMRDIHRHEMDRALEQEWEPPDAEPRKRRKL